jgi:hypothetical protein
MKAGLCCVLLLAGCTASDVAYDYELAWTCLSPEGCERTEDVELLDRLNVHEDFLYFHSTKALEFTESAQRFASDPLPAGCARIYAFSLFGHDLMSSTICSTTYGFELTISIPNVDPTTHSEWLVKARDLGPW